MKKYLLVFLVVLMMLAVADRALAKRPDPQRMTARMVKQLGLDKQQAERFSVMNETLVKQEQLIWEKNRALGEKLKSAMSQEKPNMEIVHKLAKEIGGNMTEMQIKRIDNLMSLKQLLNDDQKKKFESLLDKRRG